MSKAFSNPLRLMSPLTGGDIAELEQFLMSDSTSDETLMLDGLDGYLTAIAIGPAKLESKDWLPGVWGPQIDDVPYFETSEHAGRILNLILRYFDDVIARLNNPNGFEPRFDGVTCHGQASQFIEGEPWALGFMDGVALSRQSWQPLLNDADSRAWMRPLHLLGADNLTREEEALTRWPCQRAELAKQIPKSIAAIYRYWSDGVSTAPTQPRSKAQSSARKSGQNDRGIRRYAVETRGARILEAC
ncbi:yecA family protein [Paraburkholderia hospita]|uniref:YecA family protein n=1 Tax=Paraburkholderia hospita TaxID=169430 RepID=A0ABP2PSK7_9BURK|nr:YecA family protein [Paraburkholderia hospita]EIN00483.1 yecA family protein [Paraburkholderia hospita]OUL68199.1 hypothetical protein CA602_51845 [Paraburkholderia hospita]